MRRQDIGGNSILGQLKREVLYAQRSFSTGLLCQAYGKAQMARQLEALTQAEFMEINHMTVYFMNTDREYIRHQDREFRGVMDIPAETERKAPMPERAF